MFIELNPNRINSLFFNQHHFWQIQIPVLMFDYCKTKQFEYWLNWLVFNINTLPLHEWPTHSTKPDFYILLPFNYAENIHNGAILITQSGKVPFCFPLFIIVDLFHFISFFFFISVFRSECVHIFRYVSREKKNCGISMAMNEHQELQS